MSMASLVAAFTAFREQCQVLEEWYYTFKVLYESDDVEARAVMQQSASDFFSEHNRVLRSAIKMQMARLTDPPRTSGKENLSVRNLDEMLVANGIQSAEMRSTSASIARYRELIKDERNRLGAHLDKEAHITGAIVTGHTRAELRQFFTDLQSYLDLVGNAIGLGPLDISGSGGPGDALDLISTLKHGLKVAPGKRPAPQDALHAKPLKFQAVPTAARSQMTATQSSANTLTAFLETADAWLCDGYSLTIRYLADTFQNGARIWDAAIEFNPLPAEHDLGFRIESSGFYVGQLQRSGLKKKMLVQALTQASIGSIPLVGCSLSLEEGHPIEYRSETSYRERWFTLLHLQAIGAKRTPLSNIELARIDNSLRLAHPPFDGLSDAAGWLGLTAPSPTPQVTSINVRIGPPVDLFLVACKLSDDALTITLHAHPKFDVSRCRLAIRAAPGDLLNARFQAADSIAWKRVRNGRRPGVASIHVQNADQALVMLLIDDETVRRQWFIDTKKARNNRYLAVQSFDDDLRMMREAVFKMSDSPKFESGIAGLLFLLGFTPSIQIETDAPDLVVATPSGRLAIVECSMKIADFATKIGKLVDRRGQLVKSLAASGHQAEVAAILVTRMPRDQIAMQHIDPKSQGVVLLCYEELQAGFNRVRSPSDPDQLLSDGLAQIGPPVPNIV